MDSRAQLHRIPSLPFCDHTQLSTKLTRTGKHTPRQDWSGAPSKSSRLGVRAILKWRDGLILWKHTRARTSKLDTLLYQPLLVRLFGMWTHAHIVGIEELTPKMIDITVRPCCHRARLAVIRLRSGKAYYYVGVRSLDEWWLDVGSIPTEFSTD